MVALEALACGTPVLASDSIHSLPSAIENVKGECLNSWIDGVEKMLSSKTTQSDIHDSITKHNVTHVHSSLKEIYSDLLSSQS